MKSTNKNLGLVLRKQAHRKKFSVIKVAAFTGASRTTVYSWFAGGGVTNAYRPVVTALIESLKSDAIGV